jgi:hypothetical protein
MKRWLTLILFLIYSFWLWICIMALVCLVLFLLRVMWPAH